MHPIKNIIFDLGGVLLDIDIGKTSAAFETLGINDFSGMYSLHKADALFDNLEKGLVSDPGFFNGIRNLSGLALTDSDIRTAWDALLIGFRTGSLTCLKQLQNRYRLYLLSNTNHIHYQAFQQMYKNQTGRTDFNDHFVKTYYSFREGLRKPEKEIYQLLLADAGLVAGESLFIDDLEKNIEAAAALGIQTHHLQPHEKIEDLEWETGYFTSSNSI